MGQTIIDLDALQVGAALTFRNGSEGRIKKIRKEADGLFVVRFGEGCGVGVFTKEGYFYPRWRAISEYDIVEVA